MPIDWESRRVKYKPTVDWESRRSPMSEQDYLAVATEKADIGYEERKPGIAASFGEGFSQGATLGAGDEAAAAFLSKSYGIPFDRALNQIQSRMREARAENPAAVLTGDILGSIVSSLIPGLGIAKGARLPAASMKLAGLSGLEGFTRSEGDINERARGAGVSAAVGGAIPGAGALAGKLARGVGNVAKGFLPGSSTSPRALNTAVAGGAKVLGGADDETARVYKKVLDEPEKLASSLVPPKERLEKIPEMNKGLADAFEDINHSVSKKYEELQGQAFAKNAEEGEGLNFMFQALRETKSKIDEALETIAQYPTHFAESTKKALLKAKASIDLNEPAVGNLGTKIFGLKKKAEELVDNPQMKGEVEAEIQEAMKKVGGALHRARRKVDKAINWKNPEFDDEDENILRGIREVIQTFTHGNTRGAPMMKEADDLYANFKNYAKPFEERFKGRGPEGLSAKKTGDYITDGGSQYTQAEVNAYEKAAREFFQKFGIDDTKLVKAKGDFDFLKDHAALNRLGGQTGQQTGRSLLPYAKATALGGGAGFLLGGGPHGAAIGVAITAGLTSPSLSPINYLKSLQGARNVIKKYGESKAAEIFGRAWPAVKTAVYRRMQGQEDIEAARNEFLQNFKSLGGSNAQPANQSTQMVPQKIKDYFAGGQPDPSRQISASSQQGTGGQITGSGSPGQERIQIPSAEAAEKSTVGGRTQLLLDQLIGADKIGLDPGEEPPESQPSEYDEVALALMPMFGGVTKKVTKLDFKLRKKMLEKKGKNLSAKEKARLQLMDKYDGSPEDRDKLLKSLNDPKNKPLKMGKGTKPDVYSKKAQVQRSLRDYPGLRKKHGADDDAIIKEADERSKASLDAAKRDSKIKTALDKQRQGTKTDEEPSGDLVELPRDPFGHGLTPYEHHKLRKGTEMTPAAKRDSKIKTALDKQREGKIPPKAKGRTTESDRIFGKTDKLHKDLLDQMKGANREQIIAFRDSLKNNKDTYSDHEFKYLMSEISKELLKKGKK